MHICICYTRAGTSSLDESVHIPYSMLTVIRASSAGRPVDGADRIHVHGSTLSSVLLISVVNTTDHAIFGSIVG